MPLCRVGGIKEPGSIDCFGTYFEAGPFLFSGARARRRTAVDRHDRSADVRGARRREVANEVRDFGGIAGTLEGEHLGNLVEDLLPAMAVAELLFRALVHVLDLALGQDAAGIDAHDAHAVVDALAAERPGEGALPVAPAM